MGVDTREELAEVTTLLETAKGPRVREALSGLLASLQAESGAAASPAPAVDVEKALDVAPAPDGGAKDARAAASGSQLPGLAGAVPSPPRAAAGVGMPVAPRADIRYATVDRFSWDQGGYNSPKVSVYVPLDGVGSVKDRVSCSFSTRGFDLTVKDLAGKNYRLIQNNLDKDIVPEDSKIIIKKDKVIVKLQKTKASYGSFDHWTTLAAKKTRKTNTADPQAGLMDLMKDMYDEGDANTKKVIGEAMLKNQQNRGKTPPLPSFDDPPSYGGGKPFGSGGAGGLGGLGDLGKFDGDMGDLDLDKDNGDGGWGAGGKDDFGFGSAVPPPQASVPVPAAAEEEEEEMDMEGNIDVPTKLPEGKTAPSVAGGEGVPETGSGAAEGGTALETLESLEALDD